MTRIDAWQFSHSNPMRCLAILPVISHLWILSLMLGIHHLPSLSLLQPSGLEGVCPSLVTSVPPHPVLEAGSSKAFLSDTVAIGGSVMMAASAMLTAVVS